MWTKAEEEMLVDYWGTFCLKTISTKLKKSEYSITNKVQRLGLGGFLESGEYITVSCLTQTLGYEYKQHLIWLKYDFPMKYKKVRNNRFKVIYIDDFWKWAKENKDKLDFSRLEKLSLGKEPEWLNKIRKSDFEMSQSIIKTPWTELEDKKLEYLLSKNLYTNTEIAKELRRSEGAIERRRHNLNFDNAPKRNKIIFWEDEEIKLLRNLIIEGYKFPYIASKLAHRSEKSICGYVYRIYGSEDLNVVVKKLVSGD